MQKTFIFISLFLCQTLNAYVGAVNSATAGAGAAAIEASESPFGNPATIGFLKGYHFTAGYGSSNQRSVGGEQDLAVSLSDNMKDTVVPTAFSYVQSHLNPELGETGLQRQFRLGFGNIVRPGFAFGLGINYHDDRTLNKQFTQTNIDTGLMLVPMKDLGVALHFENLLETPDSVPKAFAVSPRTTVASSYNYRKFLRLKADVISASNNSFNQPTIAAGMESYLNRWLIVRWGLQRNTELKNNGYSAGLGFSGPKFGMHYAYFTSPQDQTLTRHSVDLAVPIW